MGERERGWRRLQGGSSEHSLHEAHRARDVGALARDRNAVVAAVVDDRRPVGRCVDVAVAVPFKRFKNVFSLFFYCFLVIFSCFGGYKASRVASARLKPCHC